jgi:hypothetical protein
MHLRNISGVSGHARAGVRKAQLRTTLHEPNKLVPWVNQRAGDLVHTG